MLSQYSYICSYTHIWYVLHLFIHTYLVYITFVHTHIFGMYYICSYTHIWYVLHLFIHTYLVCITFVHTHMFGMYYICSYTHVWYVLHKLRTSWPFHFISCSTFTVLDIELTKNKQRQNLWFPCLTLLIGYSPDKIFFLS